MSVVVAEEGNKRKGEMNSAEVVQCILDIKTWFNRTPCKKNIQDGATSADIQRLEKTIDCELPSELKTLLTEVNGGLFFMDKEQMSSKDIAHCVSKVQDMKTWKGTYIPFCGDESSMMIVNSRNDEVYEWDTDDGLGDKISSSLLRFLEEYRNDLLGGHFEFLEDVGVVETMTKKKK